jgi:sulfite reductase beta subunit-like hemoprotein
MAAASVVMATAMGLVHTSYRFESRSRIVRADEQTALRLARQFRTDVHEARTIVQSHAADGPLVTFTGPTGRINYRVLAQGLVRTTQPATGPNAREEFLFSRPIAWTVEASHGLFTLRGTSATDGRHPPLAIEVAAAIARDAAPAREEGASP